MRSLFNDIAVAGAPTEAGDVGVNGQNQTVGMELVHNVLYNRALHNMLKVDFLKLLRFLQQGLIIAVLDFAAICKLSIKFVVEVVVGRSGVAAGEVVEAFIGVGTGSAARPIVGGKIPTIIALLLVLGGTLLE